MPPADGKYISLHGKEIHYFEQPGQGVPVVMIHGQPGTYKDFDPVVAELPGLHLISIDRPGFGWSKGGWLPYQEQIDVVHELLTALKLAPAVLVGHSFGGTLALGVARRYPQDVAKPDPRGARGGGHPRSKTHGCAAGPLHPVQSVAGGAHHHRRHRRRRHQAGRRDVRRRERVRPRAGGSRF